MKRRNMLIGIGGIAGAGAAIGTGAFDQVSADRTVSLNVEGDADAYLGLTVINDAYATTDADGVLELTFDEDGGAGGEGFNPNSTTRINEVFAITNQGNQDVGVSIEKGELADGVEKFDFIAQIETDEDSLVRDAPVTLESGESFDVGVEAEVSSSDAINSVIEDDEITITANIDDEEGNELQPVAVGNESFDTIGAALEFAGEGDTVQVLTGTAFEEDLIIEDNNLVLEATSNAMPQLDGFVEISADGVTVSGFEIEAPNDRQVAGGYHAVYVNPGVSGLDFIGNSVATAENPQGRPHGLIVESGSENQNILVENNEFVCQSPSEENPIVAYVNPEATNVNFIENTFTGSSTGAGVVLGTHADDSEVSENSFEADTEYAQLEVFGENVTIDNNEFEQSDLVDSYVLDAGAAYEENPVLDLNTVLNSAGNEFEPNGSVVENTTISPVQELTLDEEASSEALEVNNSNEEEGLPYIEFDTTDTEVEITFNNPADRLYAFDVRVDGEDGTEDQFSEMTISQGPLEGESFGLRYNGVSVSGGETETRVYEGAESVEVILRRGPEQNYFIPWITFSK